MTIYERILLTLDQISVRGKSDAERMLGVIATVEKLGKENEEKDKTISDLQGKIVDLEARLVEKTEEE